MSRSELGALVSRALAVWCLGSASYLLVEAASSLTNPVVAQRHAISDPSIVSGLVWIALAALLWFKAGSFGTWSTSEPAPQVPEQTFDKSSVATGLLQAVALYWIVYSIVHMCAPLTDPKTYQSAAATAKDLNGANLFGLGLLGLLSLVLLVSARELSRKLCKA